MGLTRRPGSRSGRGAIGLVALLVVVLLGIGHAGAATASPAERAGGVVLIDQSGSPMQAGGSASVFWFRLPDGAACQGDTRHDDYRVQGFIVPGSDDPGSLRWLEIKPDGEGRWGLYAEDTTPFTQLPTDVSEAGQPGPINELPPASFAVFPPGTLPDGDYRIGVACTLASTTTRYWDARFAVVNDSSDQPGQFRWSVDGAASSGGSSTGSFSRVVIVVLVGAATAGLVLLITPRIRARLHSQEKT